MKGRKELLNEKRPILVFVLANLCGLAFVSSGCSTGVESSPEPGLLRVTLQSNPEDMSIVIVGDTLVVSQEDSFGVTIFQGRVFKGDDYSFLFKDTLSYRIEDITYDMLALDSTAEYERHKIYESYVPPIDYDRLQFGMSVSLLKVGCPEGKKGLFCKFDVPVELQQGVSPFLDLYQDFTVFENRVTEINLQMSPFNSVERFRDTYHFTPEISIISVQYF